MTDTLTRSRHDRIPPEAPHIPDAPRSPRGAGAVLSMLLAAVLLLAGFQVGRGFLDDVRAGGSGAGDWLDEGQGAYLVGTGDPVLSGDQRPAPIASLAKVMTAYVVLQRMPLQDGDDGPWIDVTEADVADTQMRQGRGESLVPLSPAADLTLRDALMAVLLPSANNVAVLLARTIAGSTSAFVAQMNDAARALGMRDTTYTDPSGYDDGTVSTAADQLRLARVAAADPTLSQMMATPVYWIPYAGEIRSTDALLGVDGFVGMKTGSHDAAGGCFMFRAQRIVNGYEVEVIGVVMGQRSDVGPLPAAFAAAHSIVDRVAPIDQTAIPR